MLTCDDDRGIHRITETLNLMEIALSIEQALKDLTDAVALNTTALNNLLSSTATVAGSPSTTTASTDADDSADTTDEAPKRERGKPSPGKSKRTAAEVAEDKAADEAEKGDSTDTADTADTDAVTFDSLKKELGTWLGEFARAEDRENPEGTHPEVGARKEAIKTLLGKLGAEKLPDIAGDATKIGKLHTWLNGSGKAGKKDKETGELVFGEGRWAADPVEDGEGGDEDDLYL